MPDGEEQTYGEAEVRFAGFTLNLRQGRVWGTTGEVVLRPKTFALLAYLVKNAGRVLSKDELLDAVWPDVTVTEDSLTQCVHSLRDALGEVGQNLVRTVPRRGYLFNLPGGAKDPVRVTADPVGVDQPVLPERRQGSIAILPFDSALLFSAQDRLWFDGVVNDVISQLARLRSFDVIARGSAFAVRDMAGDPKRAGQRLGSDYVLSGSVEASGDGFRLRLDLVRTDVGAILWTDEIGVERTGFLGLVGAVVDRIVASVLTEVTTAERNRARLVPDQSLTAWQAYHRGLEAFAIYSEPTLMRARSFFSQATELDPGFVRAFAALTECQATLARSPFCRDARAEATAALRTAEHAMRLDEAAPSAQFAYAHARWLHGDAEVALMHAEQSVALSPSFAEGFAEVGFYESLYGNPERAIASLDRAEMLNPLSPFVASFHADRSVAHLQKHDLEGAAFWAMKAVSRRHSYPQMQVTGAIVLAAAQQMSAAQAIVDALRQANAVFDPVRILKSPVNIRGPARDLLVGAVSDLVVLYVNVDKAKRPGFPPGVPSV